MRLIDQDVSLHRAKRILGLSISTLSERASSLAERGFLTKGRGAPRNAPWQLTANGLRVVRDSSLPGGPEAVTRTPLRGHRLIVEGEILRRPNDALLRERLPGGWKSYSMQGWVKHHGLAVMENVRVRVQVNRKTAVFYLPEIWGTTAHVSGEALKWAGSAGSYLLEYGVEIGDLRFQGPPEFALKHHPVAVAFAQEMGGVGQIVPGLLWVDNSDGEIELEGHALLMDAVHETPFQEGMEWRAWVRKAFDRAGITIPAGGVMDAV